jgi:hypothetical protein
LNPNFAISERGVWPTQKQARPAGWRDRHHPKLKVNINH